ncbi:MAG: hypothetical protein JW771_02195 [Candidatus Thermoplasmatota archaeon]|nr:hypothetical protein [Candidatus Thermoplasmatota archaeon]
MGEFTYSKPIRSRISKKQMHLPTKLISVVMAVLLVTTLFSSVTFAGDGGTEPVVGDDTEKVAKSSTRSAFAGMLRDFLEQRRAERKGLLSLTLVTIFNGKEQTTRLRTFLPTSLDIDDDGDKDIRVWVIRRPAIQLLPPSVGLKTSLLVRRLPGLDESQIDDEFSLYIEYETSKLVSRIVGYLPPIRIGYQSPDGEEIPKSCFVYHKTFPQLAYPRQKTKHTVGINPISIAGESQLNLLFSIPGAENETDSPLTIQVNHSPAIKNEITFSRSKDHFVRRGQTLDIKRSSMGKSNVSVFIKDISIFGKGSLVVNDIPKKISLSWKLARTGYIELNSYSAGTGAVKAAVNGLMTMGFTAETGINAGISWENVGLRSLTKGKPFGISFDTEDSMALSDFYLSALLEDLGYNLEVTSSLLALTLKTSADIAQLVLTSDLRGVESIDSIDIDVDNADVTLEDCIVDVEYVGVPERPTVTITSPEDGDTVSGTVFVTGTANAPSGREISSVEISIDGSDPVVADGNMSWSYEWDTTVIANGDHTITAISYDDEGGVSPNDSIIVTVDNEGNNWYPLVTIDALPMIITSDTVTISGTASDPDGDEQLVSVEIQINNGDWTQVEGTTTWSYEWDVSKLTGFYTIKARGYDGEDYTATPLIAEKKVFIRFSSVLDVTLDHASLDMKNFVVQGDLNFTNITNIEVPSFSAEGSGAFYLGEDAISVSAEGAIHLDNTSITVINSTGKPEKLLDTLAADVTGDGRFDIVPKAISAILNANVDITAKQALGLNDITLSFIGNISAHMAVDESGNVALGGKRKDDHFYVDIREFIFTLDDLVDVGADQLLINGTGNISVIDDELVISGDLNECLIDNFHVDLGNATFSFSGAVDRIRNGELLISFTDLFNFDISYDGDYDLTILNPQVSVNSNTSNISALAQKVMVRTDGSAHFSYEKNETQAEVTVILHDIKFIGLCLYCDEFSFGPTDIGWNGSFHLVLSADLFIEMGEDWIRITIGGNGRAHIDLYTNMQVNDSIGYLNAELDLATGEDALVIYLFNLSADVGFNIYGGAVTNLELLELYLENSTTAELLVDISIANLSVGFDMDSTFEDGILFFMINEAGVAMDNGHVAIALKDAVNLTVEGTVDVALSSSVSGVITVILNETGVTSFVIDFTGEVYVEIAGLDMQYHNGEKGTDVNLSADLIAINGNAKLLFTADYINASLGVGNDNGSGIILDNFLLNATIASMDVNLFVTFGLLDITSGVTINLSDGMTISTSADITAEDLYLVLNSDSQEMFISVDFELFEITGNGGGAIVIDENFSLISGSSDNTDFVLENASLDVFISEMMLYAMLEDMDISVIGADVEFIIDISEGFDNVVMMADLVGDSAISVNTLWAYIGFVFIELRVDDLMITGPTVIDVDVDTSSDVLALVTIDAVEGITADEFTIAGFLNIYGIDGGPDVSVGIDNLGNILIGLDGEWHFDMILLMNTLLINNIDFDGKMDSLLLGFGGFGGPIGIGWIYLEGSFSEASTASFNVPSISFLKERKLIFEFEPGDFMFTVDGLDTLEVFGEDSILKINLGVFGYSSAPITCKIDTPNLSIEGITLFDSLVGFIELNAEVNSLLLPMLGDDERDIDITLSIKGNHDRVLLFNGLFDINGSGELSIELQASGSLATADFYGSFKANWNGVRYFTLPEFRKYAFEATGEIDISFGDDSGSGEYTIETNEAIIIMNENTNTVTILDEEGTVLLQEGTVSFDENGELIILNGQGQQILGGEGGGSTSSDPYDILLGIFDHLYRWRWKHFSGGGWQRIPIWDTRPAPVVKAAVTLLTRAPTGNELHVLSWDILPGGKLNFSAWYKPGPNNHGPYDFIFNYGDGTASDPVYVPASQDPIKIYAPENHQYITPDQYIATITVIDYGNSGDTTMDTFTVDVVEEYLRVSPGRFIWNFEQLEDQKEEDGKVYDSFEVKHEGNATYTSYTLEWNLTHDTMRYGTNWTFDTLSGSLEPGESEIVNFSFTPPSVPGDYTGANVSINNINDPDESTSINFNIYYGLVDLLPDSPQIIYIEGGEIATFDDLFWVFSNRWENLDWVISNITFNESFNPDLIDYSFIPGEGIIRPGDPLTPVSLYLDASNEQFIGCQMTVTVQRRGDTIEYTADNDSIYIDIRIRPEGSSNPGSDWITPDSHIQNWWYWPRRAHDNYLGSASSYRRLHGGWTNDPLILTLDDPITCCGFRINAKAGDNLDKLEVKLYNDNDLQFTKIFSAGQWENHDWTEWDFGTSETVNKVKIRQHLSSGTFKGHWAVVWEFDFLKES